MKIATVMDEIGQALRAIPSLRVWTWPPGTVTPPAAVVSLPDRIDFEVAYSRGCDTLTLTIVVVVGRASDRAGRDLLAAYLDGSGQRSVKAAIDGHAFASADSVTVTGAETDIFAIGGTDHLAAVFDVTIVGKGA